ncbi:TransThyretin-Related family domain [Caenorhabditis elegans]|uniref:TransThyretin-Related family domain n=1 Tax=Caenorhabditis elegans TaxID=6239 RepID=C0Z1Y8_CAEEL|nr:TransThyretin-Related family domain [Caenorhabditis elegans]CCD70937.2 TransThyretin-Related family domain [Caenorhabditis elegans]
MIRLVSFAVFLLVSVDALTKFHFNGQLFCNLPKFQYKMIIYEWDKYNGDDPISHMAPVQSHAPHTYRAEAQDTNDGPFDKEFEIYMIMVHSCSNDGKNRELRVDLGHYPVKPGDVTRTVNINIHNVGKLTSEKIGKRRFYDGRDVHEVYEQQFY